MPRIEVKAEGLVEAIALYNGARARWQERLKKTATRFGEFGVTYIQKRFRTGGTTDTRTRVRSGRLRRAYRYAVKALKDSVELQLGIIRPDEQAELGVVALVQERGARIVAKPGKALAIPIGEALTPAGVPRGRPRDFENTFIIRRYNKPPMIFQRQSNGENEPLFILLKSVTIPARPALLPTVQKLRPEFEAAALQDLRESLGGKQAA